MDVAVVVVCVTVDSVCDTVKENSSIFSLIHTH